MEHVHWMDDEVIPGAYYGETTWMWPPEYPESGDVGAAGRGGLLDSQHVPPRPRLPGTPRLVGRQPRRFLRDIGPMAIQIDDEIIPLESSWVAYVPADLPHMPVFYSGVRSQIHTRPTLHWTSGPGGVYKMGDDDKVGHAGQEEQAGPAARVVDPRESKYARYLVYGTDPGIRRPEYMRPLDPAYTRPMAYIDETIIPDAEFGCDTRWLLPGDTSKAGQVIMDAHTLPTRHLDGLRRLQLRRPHRPLRRGGAVDRRGEARHQQGLLGLHPAGRVPGPDGRPQYQQAGGLHQVVAHGRRHREVPRGEIARARGARGRRAAGSAARHRPPRDARSVFQGEPESGEQLLVEVRVLA